MDKTNKVLTRSGKSLSWDERVEMIEEYLAGGYTKQAIWEKYTGQKKEHGDMLYWMRKLGYIQAENTTQRRKFVPFPKTPEKPLSTDHQNDSGIPLEAQKRIKELERQLEDAKLKAEGYELMLDLVEREYKIPIRKKPNTK